MMTHLHTKVIEFVNNSTDEERILSTKKFKWIGYTQAKKILDKLDDLKNYPTNLRMPNLLLVGDSNNGKTAILDRFNRKNLSYVNETTGHFTVPVLYIQAPPEPDEKRFYNAILESLFAPYKSSEKLETRERRVIHLLQKVNLKLLIIDEIHHMLAGTMAKQRSFLNVLKHLSNELKISIVCAGTKDAFNAIQTDPQLANRFEPRVLKKWTNDEEYLRLLASFENIMPLKKASNLIEGGIATKILYQSEGLIGEIAKIIELSTSLAIESKIEKITKNIIDNIEYVRPSDRRKMIYK